MRKLRQLQESNDKLLSEKHNVFLEESFTENEMLLCWNKYRDKIDTKGYKIIASIMSMSQPKLDGSTILYEVPNESSKIELESEFPGLLGHLKGHLKNHSIKIDITVNETIKVRKAFTPIEKFQQMAEKNPALELLRKTFDLNV